MLVSGFCLVFIISSFISLFLTFAMQFVNIVSAINIIIIM